MFYYNIRLSDNNLTIGVYEKEINNNTSVVIETERGMQYGKIISVSKKSDKENKILRLATSEDTDNYLANLKIAKEALISAKKEANNLNLKMNFIAADLTLDKKQLLLIYYAEERIDFRQLAKKLASLYKTRIELHQIGTRDKAKHISGCGLCGEKLCCSRFLNQLNSVSMSMAKNQNLALNPTKINGVCGRLLCCLAYEDENYSLCRKNLPKINEVVKTEFGEGKVTNIDILNQKYTVEIDGSPIEIECNANN